MLCWPVYLVGGFFISLLLVDLYQNSWNHLGYHAGLGICFTGLYYLFCLFFGNDISMAVLFVPAVFILMFLFTSWLFYKNIRAQNCCITCDPNGSPVDSSHLRNPLVAFWNWLLSEPPKKKCSKAT